MKLAAPMIDKTLTQLEAKVIPDDHPALPELNKRFGEHTFFLSEEGLSIVELMDEEPGKTTGVVVNLATWTNDEDSAVLEVHEPDATEMILEFGTLTDGQMAAN